LDEDESDLSDEESLRRVALIGPGLLMQSFKRIVAMDWNQGEFFTSRNKI
jgi:hypothetical protein